MILWDVNGVCSLNWLTEDYLVLMRVFSGSFSVFLRFWLVVVIGSHFVDVFSVFWTDLF